MNFMSGEGMPPMQEHDMDVTHFSEDPYNVSEVR
jgi:hypothetical protein